MVRIGGVGSIEADLMFRFSSSYSILNSESSNSSAPAMSLIGMYVKFPSSGGINSADK